jgi:hypothetical protein
MSLLQKILALALLASLGACTSVPVDPNKISEVKKVTITKLDLPEYTYLGRDGTAAAKHAGVAASYYAFGVIGLAVGDAIRAQSEQPFRDAIGKSLRQHTPTFENTVQTTIEQKLSQRGITVTWIAPPSKLPDNSGYDLATADADTDLVVELFPFAAGFSFEKGKSNPNLDIRWRLLKRYPNGRLIETNRGTVFYDATINIGGLSSVQIPTNLDYAFDGHVLELGKHGDKPAIAMRELGVRLAQIVIERALPVSQAK